jgi:hypothetical protein
MYEPVPPAAEIVAAPLLPLLQLTFVIDVTLDVSPAGCVMVTVWVLVQELASVMVQVYVPAARPVAVAAVPPAGAQEYVYEGVPPETEIVAAPLLPPLQLTFVVDKTPDVSTEGCVIVTAWVLIQALPSVMVHVYVPAERPAIVAAVLPPGDQE